VLSAAYAALARRRRERYASRPDLRRRLHRPVISVGNLAVGGRGKTPLVATVARLLLEMGERPAILSRGYGRRHMADGVVVVRDPAGIRADLDRAGDEPLMLARQLPGASVLASPDRYLAGRLAEHHLGATVHVLDDGFQHLQLERDVDIVLVGREDVDAPVTLPAGRLRDPLDTLIVADAIVTVDEGIEIRDNEPGIPVFHGRRRLGAPQGVTPGTRVLAAAGIARPDRFFDDLRRAGWDLAGVRAYGDHHRYSRRDVDALVAAAREAGAGAILTTEKDYARLRPFRPLALPAGWVPLTMEPDPPDEFRRWLAGSLDEARDIWRGSASPGDKLDYAALTRGRP
jgi:tetraacyldisaccharide 4'-kinase